MRTKTTLPINRVRTELIRRRPRVKLDKENPVTTPGKIFDYTFDFTFE